MFLESKPSFEYVLASVYLVHLFHLSGRFTVKYTARHEISESSGDDALRQVQVCN